MTKAKKKPRPTALERARRAVTDPASPARWLADDIEALDLGASEIACAVADAYVRTKHQSLYSGPSALRDALDRLELITRPSALRKVRP